jgi:hypothetical protein
MKRASLDIKANALANFSVPSASATRSSLFAAALPSAVATRIALVRAASPSPSRVAAFFLASAVMVSASASDVDIHSRIDVLHALLHAGGEPVAEES